MIVAAFARRSLIWVFGILGLVTGCSSGHQNTRTWLAFEQGDEESYFHLIVTTPGGAAASAKGPLVGGKRVVGQTSTAELTQDQVEELKSLVATNLLDQYESDDKLGAGSHVSDATALAFAVWFDSAAVDSFAPRTVFMGFRNEEALSEPTRALLRRLNDILRDIWSRGNRTGPNLQVATPPTL